MRDERTTNDEQLKIELLSQWKLEAEFRNSYIVPQPIEVHQQLLSLFEVIMGKSQVDNVGPSVSEKPILLHEDVHLLNF